MALTRRERRQAAADMEIGRRYHLWYGFSGAAAAMVVGFVAAIGLLVAWVAAPAALFEVLKVLAWCVAVPVGLWLFWLVGIRRR